MAWSTIVSELTGDTEGSERNLIKTSDIMQVYQLVYASFRESKRILCSITTPEKWDAVTRKEEKSLVDDFKLILIDEVHILGEKRGSTLEVIVNR